MHELGARMQTMEVDENIVLGKRDVASQVTHDARAYLIIIMHVTEEDGRKDLSHVSPALWISTACYELSEPKAAGAIVLRTTSGCKEQVFKPLEEAAWQAVTIRRLRQMEPVFRYK
jgi:hypothetical protein